MVNGTARWYGVMAAMKNILVIRSSMIGRHTQVLRSLNGMSSRYVGPEDSVKEYTCSLFVTFGTPLIKLLSIYFILIGEKTFFLKAIPEKKLNRTRFSAAANLKHVEKK